MIYPYVKVNYKVVDYLGIRDDRYQFPDGNYMLWKFDLMTLGGNNDETLRRIGGVGMSSEQVREEQQGGEPTPLPVAEDPQFIIDEVPVVETPEEEEPVDEKNEEPLEETVEDEPSQEEEETVESNEEESNE